MRRIFSLSRSLFRYPADAHRLRPAQHLPALRLAADKVDGLWVGALMAANYFGLVLGGKVGHRLIARVGHIRAYVACAGVVTAAVLGHGLLPWLPAWIALRMVMGLGLMCQYMVIESWLNEQADASQRGAVFGGYMAASYLGLVLGQMILVAHPQLGPELLMLVAFCFALCLVPLALTHKIHPQRCARRRSNHASSSAGCRSR